ncbi:MAG: hypothetical protein Q7U68_06065, partial [Candidatus Roizmanbacteria bacterium]|nr:hypothetical protein [Candidatus Roizmanbacteria bacterium]
DRKMLKQAAKVSQDMGLNQVRFENQSIYDLDSSYRRDVLIALAIIHWFKHTQRPHFLTFEGIFEYLDNLVGECLFVEYIAPEDPTFIQDPQLTRDMSVDKTEFSRDQFLHCIEKRFSFVKHIGDSRRMRSLYLARR